MTVTKEDLNRVHTRIDETNNEVNKTRDGLNQKMEDTNRNINRMAVAMERLAVQWENLNVPVQPCKYLETHLEDHKNNTDNWKKPIIAAIVGLIVLALQSLFIYWLAGMGNQ